MNAIERRSVRGGPAVKNLLLAVCRAFQLRGVEVLLGRSRVHALAQARCYAASVLRAKEFAFSTPEIGKILGGRDHTSILYYLKKYVVLLRDDVHFRDSVQTAESIRERLDKETNVTEAGGGI